MLDMSFLDMAGNYEDRLVANDKVKEAIIDTVEVIDTSKSYETGITHPLYNSGSWIIVEEYDTKEEAEKGHDKWKKTFEKILPEYLDDVSTSNWNKSFGLSGVRYYRQNN